VTRGSWQEIVRGTRAGCEAAGLDLVHPFDLSGCDWRELSRHLPGEPWPRSSGLGILIGNTRRFWPRFVAACRSDHRLADAPHPLDRYVALRLSDVAASCPAPARLIFGHVTEPAAFPLARLADQVGLASLSPSHLAVHPEHGPWVALRAVLLVDVDGPPLTPRAPSPCAGCAAPCVPALAHAIAVSGEPLDSAAIAAHAREWIAVRDACPIGRASRYDDAQLSYHYAPARSKLFQGS